MTVILKDVPGLVLPELLEALYDLTNPNDPPIQTGYGGVVISEDLAARFLKFYLIAADTASEPHDPPAGLVEPTPATRPATGRGHVARRKGGEA